MNRTLCFVSLCAISAFSFAGCSKTPVYKDCDITVGYDGDNDSLDEYSTVYTYDADKHLVKEETIITNGNQTATTTVTFTYGTDNDTRFPTKQTTVVTLKGSVATVTTTTVYTNTYSEDDEDQVARTDYDATNDGAVDATTTYAWSEDGKTITASTDYYSDGEIDDIVTYEYYYYPLFTFPFLPISHDTDGNGSADYTYTNTMNDDGFVGTVATQHGDTVVTDTYTYDDNYNLISIVNSDSDGSINSAIHLAGTCYE